VAGSGDLLMNGNDFLPLGVIRLKKITSFYQVYVEIMAVLTHLQRNEELPAPSSGRSLLVTSYGKKGQRVSCVYVSI